jgi:hypothetical protein
MVSLASSFRLRNKLKERIRTLTDAIDAADFSKTAGTEENTSQCDGSTLEEAVREVNALMSLLQDLNARIESANQVNRPLLIELETIKAKMAFYTTITLKCRRVRAYEIEYDEQGEQRRVAKEPLLDQKKMTSALANLKKEKDALEERLAVVNMTATVDLDPDTILARI